MRTLHSYALISLSLLGHLSAQNESSSKSPENQDREWIGGRPWIEWERSTGDWAGLRDSYGPLSIEGSYVADYSSVWDGGVSSRSTYRSLTDINLTLDLGEAANFEGATLFLDAYSQVGRNGADAAGDIQVYSNVDEANTAQISELWFEHQVQDGRWRAKVGKVDANGEFCFLESALEFTHSSAGFTPTIFVFPTYPNPAMSVNLLFDGENNYAGFGFYDGATAEGLLTGRRGPSTFFDDKLANSYFSVLEGGATWGDGDAAGSGRAGAGVWHHSAGFGRFDGGMEDGTEGFYLLMEHKLTVADPANPDARGFTVFVEYGASDGNVSDYDQTLMVGGYCEAPLPGRGDDSMGLLASWADLSDKAGAGYAKDETAIEFFYKAVVTPAFSLKPGLHYIVNPSGDPAIDDALVGTVRFEVTF